MTLTNKDLERLLEWYKFASTSDDDDELAERIKAELASFAELETPENVER